MKKKKLKKAYEAELWRTKHLLAELGEANKHLKTQTHEIKSLMLGIGVRDTLIDELKTQIEEYASYLTLP